MATLSDTALQVRKTLMDHILAHGTCPAVAELSRRHNMTVEAMSAILHDLEAALVVALQTEAHARQETFQDEPVDGGLPKAGEIFYVRPFAAFKNHYRISVDGVQKWYGECAVECCGISSMFPGKEVVVESRCRQTGEPVRLVGRDGALINFSPATLVVHFGFPLRKLPDNVVGWCDFNSFFASEAAARDWQNNHPGVKGALRDPETTARFVGIVAEGRLDYDYKLTLPLSRMVFQPRRHGFTKQIPGLGFHFFDPFFLPTPGMLLSMRRHGLKPFMRITF
ncbi:MAG: alkylmercury lyase family protein [Thermodesulfobacteriota bacterium]